MKLLENLYHYDSRMLLWCTRTRYQKPLATGARLVSRTGDGYVQVLLSSLLFLIDDHMGKEFFLTVLIAFTIYLPIYWALKNSLKRRRPPDVIPTFKSTITASDKFSFPSGHSAAAFLFANLTALFYGVVAWPLYLWASVVALSRVVLGVHFPSDILAGITLGTVVALNVLPVAIAL